MSAWEQETCPTCGVNDCDPGETCTDCEAYEEGLDNASLGGLWDAQDREWRL